MCPWRFSFIERPVIHLGLAESQPVQEISWSRPVWAMNSGQSLDWPFFDLSTKTFSLASARCTKTRLNRRFGVILNWVVCLEWGNQARYFIASQETRKHFWHVNMVVNQLPITTELRKAAWADLFPLLGSGKWTACGWSHPALQRPPHLCFTSQCHASNCLWPSALAPSSAHQWTLKPTGCVCVCVWGGPKFYPTDGRIIAAHRTMEHHSSSYMYRNSVCFFKKKIHVFLHVMCPPASDSCRTKQPVHVRIVVAIKKTKSAFVRKLSNCSHFHTLLWTYNAYMYDVKTCIWCISSTEALSWTRKFGRNHELCVWSLLTARQVRGLNTTFPDWGRTEISDQYWNTGDADNKALFCSDIWENSHYCMSIVEIFPGCGPARRRRRSYDTAGTGELGLVLLSILTMRLDGKTDALPLLLWEFWGSAANKVVDSFWFIETFLFLWN